MKKLIFLFCLISLLNTRIGHGQSKPAKSDSTSYQLYLTQIAAAEAFLQLNKISTAKNYLYACDKKFRGIEWHFLNANLNQHKSEFTKAGITSFPCIALNPGNTLLAAGTSDSNILILSYPSLELIKELKGHSASVSTLAFSSDGKTLASGGRDHTVIMWDVATGKVIAKNDTSFSRGIYQVRFNHTNTLLGVVSWELQNGKSVMGFVKLLDADNASEIKKIETEPHPAAGIVFSNDDKNMIVNTWGQITYGYNVATGKTNWKYDLSGPEEYNAFHSIDISPDGKIIAIGSTDHRIHFLHAETGALLHRIEPWEGHSKTVKAVQFSRDGNWLASAGEDQTIFLWKVKDFTKAGSFIGHTQIVANLCWSKDGNALVSSAMDGTIKIWNVNEPFERKYDICNNGPWQTPLTADRKYFAAPSSDKKLVIYEAATGKPYKDFGAQSGLCADISASSKWLVTSSFDGIVRLWDIASGKEAKTFTGHTSRVDGVAYLNNKDIVVSVGDSTMRAWNVVSGEPVSKISFSIEPFRIVANAAGSQVFVGFGNGVIKTYETNTWHELDTTKCLSDTKEIALSPDGKWLAAFSGRSIEIYEAKTLKRKWVLSGHDMSGYGLGFSPDGKYLVSGSYDQTFKLWDLSNGACTLTYHGYNDIVYSCKFISDNELLIGTAQGVMRYYKF